MDGYNSIIIACLIVAIILVLFCRTLPWLVRNDKPAPLGYIAGAFSVAWLAALVAIAVQTRQTSWFQA